MLSRPIHIDSGSNNILADELADDSDSETEKIYNELKERMNELYEEQKGSLFQYIEDHNNSKTNNSKTNNSKTNNSKTNNSKTNNSKTNNSKTNIINYSYEAINELIDINIENYIETYDLNEVTIHICPYMINNSAKYPFLQYVMQKYSEDHPYFPNMIRFHSFTYLQGMNIMELCQSVVDIIFLCYTAPKQQFERKYNYKGFTNTKTGNKNNLYLFFDFSSYSIDSHKLYKANDLYLVLIDEIVNHKSVANFPVDPCAQDFFINNNEFMYLTDNDDFYIESPIVVYSNCSRNMIDFKLTFGVSPSSNPTALLGPYYYFTDYKNAVEQKATYDAIIRLAIFTRNMKAPFNHLDDSPDKSQITQNMLLQDTESVDYIEARNTIRFSDRDALWTEYYDSVYIGKLELDNGKFYDKAPLWIIKDHECEMPLSSFVIKDIQGL